MTTPSKTTFRNTDSKIEIFLNWVEFGYELGFDVMNATMQVIPRGLIVPLSLFALQTSSAGFFKKCLRTVAYWTSRPILVLTSILGIAAGFVGAGLGIVVGVIMGAAFAPFKKNPFFPYFGYLSHYGNDNKNLYFEGKIGKFLFDHQRSIAWATVGGALIGVALSWLGFAVNVTPWSAALLAACTVMSYFMVKENWSSIKKISHQVSRLLNKGRMAINKRLMAKQVTRIQAILNNYPEPFTEAALAPFTDPSKLNFIPAELENAATSIIQRTTFLEQLSQIYNQEWVAEVLKDITNPILAGFRGNRKLQYPNCNVIEQRAIRNYFDKVASLRDNNAGAFTCHDYLSFKTLLQNKPWVHGYLKSPSDFANFQALQAEDIVRSHALTTIDNWDGDRKIKMLLKQILMTHPGELAKHDKYHEICVQLPLKIMNSPDDLKIQYATLLKGKMRAAGLAFNQELPKHFDFLARKKAALAQPHTLKKYDAEGGMTRNNVFFMGAELPAAGGADPVPTMVLKSFVDPQLHRQEIAGTQMAELLGFGEVTLSATTSQPALFNFDQAGNIIKTMTVDMNGEALPTVALQPFQKAKSGQQLWSEAFAYVEESVNPVAASLSKNNSANASSAIDQLLSIDLRSFQLAVIKSIVLGEGDQNPGNTLFTTDSSGKQKIITIDHEDIMPEDNFNVDKIVPLRLGSSEIPARIKNVFPMRCWLLGLPAAKQPLLPEVIEHCLRHLDIDMIKQYHRSSNLFSSQQIQAQTDRINVVRQFLENAKKSADVSSLALFNHFAETHPSYHKLKHEHGISDLLLYIQLGMISGDRAEIQAAQDELIRERGYFMLNFSNRVRNHPHLGAVYTERNVQALKQANVALRNHAQLKKFI